MAAHDACPKCGGPKRTKNRQCAACRGYGRRRHVMPSGYVRVWAPDHAVANADGYALEHRIVLFGAGITVPPGWHVHHINGDRSDNQLENLAVCTAKGHTTLHAQLEHRQENQHGVFPILLNAAARVERERTRSREAARARRARARQEIAA